VTGHLRAVLLGERADRVPVDEDPDAAREGLEQLQRALTGDDLRQLSGRDRRRRERPPLEPLVVRTVPFTSAETR